MTNTLNLDWKHDDDIYWDLYFASMPEIPGHPGLLYKILVRQYDHPWRWYKWEFALPLWLSPTATSAPHLYNEDFDIPATSTAEAMMTAVDNLTVDDIVRVLTAKGYIK
ncbi:MAG: hypothetical protein IIT36_04075 [Aeriscardovia sp.]|nr:hypothetical protein [Aeriscardovia sp.]